MRHFFNIDGRSLLQPARLLQSLEMVVSAHGCSAEDVCLELSETNQSLSSPHFVQSITRLKRNGFKLAMDDFGTGYSGLQMLYQTSPDFMKIDRFFIEGMNKDAKKRLLVKSFSSIARALDMKVIAEGVESSCEHHFAREMGCDLIQGYFVARPQLAIDQIDALSQPVHVNTDRRANPSEPKLRTLLVPAVSMRVDGTLGELFDILEEHPTQTLVPIVDSRSMPVGAVLEADVKSIMYSEYGRDLMKNKCCHGTLSNYISRILSVDVHAKVTDFLDLDIEQLQIGALVTSSGKYVGYLPTSAILSLAHAHQLNETRKLNPLTGLPSNEPIKDFMAGALRSDDVDRVFIYFDFDNFKPFNDKYGFRQGDRAIVLFSECLAKMFSSKDAFVGHVGGDDFFAGATGSACAWLIGMTGPLQMSFMRDVQSFYSTADREAGGIESAGRDGTPTRFPLMACSAGIIEIKAGAKAPSMEQLSQLMAEAKKKAKQQPERYYHQVIG